jgi:hypothetical protein
MLYDATILDTAYPEQEIHVKTVKVSDKFIGPTASRPEPSPMARVSPNLWVYTSCMTPRQLPIPEASAQPTRIHAVITKNSSPIRRPISFIPGESCSAKTGFK